jgi:hypothetical protein
MKIVNKTKWRTEDIAAIARACFAHVGCSQVGKTLTVMTSRRGHVHGRAAIGRFVRLNGFFRPQERTKRLVEGTWVHMWVPTVEHEVQVSSSAGMPDFGIHESFARVLEHEVEHLVGRRHPDMHPKMRRCIQDVSSWLGGLLLRPEEKRQRTPDELAQARQDRVEAHGAHLQAKVAEWERKEAAAGRHAKKWRDRLRAWERRNVPRLADAAGTGRPKEKT